MRELLLVCAGGAVGSGLRFLVSSALLRAAGPAFPWGTLVVNGLGSFAIGAVMQGALQGQVSPGARMLLAAGLLGGFTTFSSFSWETLRLVQAGQSGLALANVGGNLVLSLVAVGLGMMLVRAAG